MNREPLPPFDHDPASWFQPLSLEEFRATHWRRRPLVVPGDEERLGVLRAALGSFELPHLLTWAREPTVHAWYVDEGRPDFSLAVPVDAAYRLYRAGLTLYFHLKDSFFETPLMRAFCAALGHPSGTVAVSIFATRRGKRTAAHVDHNENITVQLTGHKRWGYALDPTYQMPLEQWSEAAAVSPPFERAELTPGSFLYLPGPWAHETEDLADSISLNLCFPNVSWAQYLAPALARALERHPLWARDASNLREGSAAALDAARREAAGLGRSLAETLTVDPEALVRRSIAPREITPHSRFRRSPYANAEIAIRSGGDPCVIVRSPWEETVLGLDAAVLPLCAWIGRQSELTAEAAGRACDSLEPDDVAEVLATLVDAGFLVPCAP